MPSHVLIGCAVSWRCHLYTVNKSTDWLILNTHIHEHTHTHVHTHTHTYTYTHTHTHKLLYRECDPDLCKFCGVAVHPSLVSGLMESAPKFRTCCNSGIRRHSYKKTLVGRSTINGWGAFLLEEAKIHTLIMEYKGMIWYVVKWCDIFLTVTVTAI